MPRFTYKTGPRSSVSLGCIGSLLALVLVGGGVGWLVDVLGWGGVVAALLLLAAIGGSSRRG